MIGLDGAEIGFIRDCGAALPNLNHALSQGRLDALRTTAEHLVGSVWPTFSTGTMPGEHGIGQRLQWDPDAMRTRRITADWLPFEPFWYGLARRGERVVALDVPFSVAARLDDESIEIINWGTHEGTGPLAANRGGLARDILRRFGRHPIGDEITVDKTPAQRDSIRRALAAGAAAKGRLARWLLQGEDWSLFLIVFGETHRGGHVLWPAQGVPPDSLRAVYQAIDAAIGEILACLDLDHTGVMIFALHGMEANYSQTHLVRPAMERINRLFTAGAEQVSAPRPAPGMIRMLRERFPHRLQHVAALALPVAVRDWILDRELTGGVDWPRTPGFALRGAVHGHIRYNLAGREARGALSPGSEAQRLYTAAIREGFLSLSEAETGERLVRDVAELGDLYPGPRSRYLPDIAIQWEHVPPVDAARSPRLGSFRRRLANGRTGEHRPAGFAALLGRWPDSASADRPSHIKDLAGVVTRALEEAA
jgi:predicted AlkP superfamily phosphohydrolase/phosphomutase